MSILPYANRPLCLFQSNSLCPVDGAALKDCKLLFFICSSCCLLINKQVYLDIYETVQQSPPALIAAWLSTESWEEVKMRFKPNLNQLLSYIYWLLGWMHYSVLWNQISIVDFLRMWPAVVETACSGPNCWTGDWTEGKQWRKTCKSMNFYIGQFKSNLFTQLK